MVAGFFFIILKNKKEVYVLERKENREEKVSFRRAI